MHTSFLLLSCCSSSPALSTLFLCSSHLSFHSISWTCSVLFHRGALVLGIFPAWQTAPVLHMTSSFSTFHPHFKDRVPTAAFLGSPYSKQSFSFLYYTSCVFPHRCDHCLYYLVCLFSSLSSLYQLSAQEAETAVGSLRKKECTSLSKTDVLKMHEGAGAIDVVLGWASEKGSQCHPELTPQGSCWYSVADDSRTCSQHVTAQGSGSQNGDTSAASVYYLLHSRERKLSMAVETSSVSHPCLTAEKNQKGAGRWPQPVGSCMAISQWV